MAGRGVQIVIEGAWDNWLRGLGILGSNPPEDPMRRAAQAFFDRTQEKVHVITGALKASGTLTVESSGDRIEASVSYGGGIVDYALDELARGGEHDYLTDPWLATEAEFGEALQLSLADMVQKAMG